MVWYGVSECCNILFFSLNVVVFFSCQAHRRDEPRDTVAHSTEYIEIGYKLRSTSERLSATMANAMEFYAESSCSAVFIVVKTNIRRVSINLM